MEMMDVDATGRKRPAAPEAAAGLEEDWRREEELRLKAPKWNRCEDQLRDDLSPVVKELLHKGHMLRVRTAANLARNAKYMEELARRCPKAGMWHPHGQVI
ncbi:unnamed protein product [Urochloa humidicola]